MSIDAIVNLAVGKIGEILVQEGKLLYGLEAQIQSLQEELTMMSNFLVDMDEEGGDERTRATIKQIRKLAYDAEDVIESYILEKSSSTAVSKTEEVLKRYVCFCYSLVRTHQVDSEVEAIKVKIVETTERWKKYSGGNGISPYAREGLIGRARTRKPIAYAHHSEDHVIGLDEDISKLVGVLADEEHSKLKVVSIVGMGGSGKTTLARKLFNHESVIQHFDCTLWVSVAQQWVARQIILGLLEKAGGRETTVMSETLSLELLGEKLHNYIKNKRYLVVLDDVWEKEALLGILPALAPLESDGSKIIVTTRNRDVVEFPDLRPLTHFHEPRRLSNKESWELFRKIALIHRQKTAYSKDFAKLEELGKEMLSKCQGLPLAVVALAGILSEKETLEGWEMVKKAMSSRIMEAGKGTHLYGAVKEMLALSYNDLPRELKPCFLYLGLFPEDCELPTGMLTRMWIAEGFISSDHLHQGEALEDLAIEYLDELIDRCVVRVASRNYEGKAKTIEVHDLLRDLAIKKAKEQDFLDILSSRSANHNARATQSRRSTIQSYDTMRFPFSTGNWHLRSLFLFARANAGAFKAVAGDERPKLSFQPILKSFKLLRVLNLVSIDTPDGTLPTEIGSLIHLRYFGLRVTNVFQLPTSIGNLRNLLTLDHRGVKNPKRATKTPNVLWKIEGLTHIYLPSYRSSMGKLSLDTLKQLRTLWGGGGGGDWMLEELPRLSKSVRKLHIGGMSTGAEPG